MLLKIIRILGAFFSSYLLPIVLLHRQFCHTTKSTDNDMNVFMIFAIVLTIAYVLYYAAMIAIDLNAQSKSDAPKEETVDVSDMAKQEEPSMTRTIVEDGNGGYSFAEPTPEAPQPETPEIAEAEEEEPQGGEQTEEEHNDPEPQPSEEAPSAPEQEEESEEGNKEENDDTPDQGEATPEPEPEPEPEDQDDDSPSNISVVPFGEEPEEKPEVSNEPFNESEVFDPSKTEPQFGIKTIIGGKTITTVVDTHCEDVNNALSPNIKKNRHAFDSAGFHDIMHNKAKAESLNIVVKDEYTRF